MTYTVKSCGKVHASCKECRPDLSLRAVKAADVEKRAPWIEQPFEEWRRWRFAKPFIDLEEEIGADVLWGTMVKVCWGGVEPRTAAKVIVLAHMDKAARAGVNRVAPTRAA